MIDLKQNLLKFIQQNCLSFIKIVNINKRIFHHIFILKFNNQQKLKYTFYQLKNLLVHKRFNNYYQMLLLSMITTFLLLIFLSNSDVLQTISSYNPNLDQGPSLGYLDNGNLFLNYPQQNWIMLKTLENYQSHSLSGFSSGHYSKNGNNYRKFLKMQISASLIEQNKFFSENSQSYQTLYPQIYPTILLYNLNATNNVTQHISDTNDCIVTTQFYDDSANSSNTIFLMRRYFGQLMSHEIKRNISSETYDAYGNISFWFSSDCQRFYSDFQMKGFVQSGVSIPIYNLYKFIGNDSSTVPVTVSSIQSVTGQQSVINSSASSQFLKNANSNFTVFSSFQTTGSHYIYLYNETLNSLILSYSQNSFQSSSSVIKYKQIKNYKFNNRFVLLFQEEANPINYHFTIFNYNGSQLQKIFRYKSDKLYLYQTNIEIITNQQLTQILLIQTNRNDTLTLGIKRYFMFDVTYQTKTVTPFGSLQRDFRYQINLISDDFFCSISNSTSKLGYYLMNVYHIDPSKAKLIPYYSKQFQGEVRQIPNKPQTYSYKSSYILERKQQNNFLRIMHLYLLSPQYYISSSNATLVFQFEQISYYDTLHEYIRSSSIPYPSQAFHQFYGGKSTYNALKQYNIQLLDTNDNKVFQWLYETKYPAKRYIDFTLIQYNTESSKFLKTNLARLDNSSISYYFGGCLFINYTNFISVYEVLSNYTSVEMKWVQNISLSDNGIQNNNSIFNSLTVYGRQCELIRSIKNIFFRNQLFGQSNYNYFVKLQNQQNQGVYDETLRYYIKVNSIYQIDQVKKKYNLVANSSQLLQNRTIKSFTNSSLTILYVLTYQSSVKLQINGTIYKIIMLKYNKTQTLPKWVETILIQEFISFSLIPTISSTQVFSYIWIKVFETKLFFVDFQSNRISEVVTPYLIKPYPACNFTQNYIYCYQEQISNTEPIACLKTQTLYYINLVALSIAKIYEFEQQNCYTWVYRPSYLLQTSETLKTYQFTKRGKKYQQTYRNSSNNLIIFQREFIPFQLQTTANNIESLETGFFKNKTQLGLCSAGCKYCIDQNTCLTCSQGLTVINASSQCSYCSPLCQTCRFQTFSKCTQCIVGFYNDDSISNSTFSQCTLCNQQCHECAQNYFNCKVCRVGYFLSHQNKCVECSQNCQICNNQAYCSSCKAGYVVSEQGNCFKCPLGCSYCKADEIMNCINCRFGYQPLKISNITYCKKCPTNCKVCRLGVCMECRQNYRIINNKCLQKCKLPCQKCSQQNPTKCTSCISPYTYSSSTNNCVFNQSCNSTASCKVCPMNYVFQGGNCMKCGNLANCKFCSSQDLTRCISCQTSYYLDTDFTCKSCSEECLSCKYDNLCYQCKDGYTVSGNFSYSLCIKCSSPCLTCFESPKNCETCIEGYTLKGWKCMSDSNIHFELLLNKNLNSVKPSQYYQILKQLLSITIGMKQDEISFQISTNDFIFQGYIQTKSNQQSDQCIERLESIYRNGQTIGDFVIVQSKFISSEKINSISSQTLQNLIDQKIFSSPSQFDYVHFLTNSSTSLLQRFFNSQNSAQISLFQLALDQSFKIINTSRDELSCALLYDGSNDKYLLYKLFHIDSQQNFADITYLILDETDLASIIIGTACLSLKIDKSLYFTGRSAQSSFTFKKSQISIDGGWVNPIFSNDLSASLTKHGVYKWFQSLNIYKIFKVFNSSYDESKIWSRGNRTIILLFNTKINSKVQSFRLMIWESEQLIQLSPKDNKNLQQIYSPQIILSKYGNYLIIYGYNQQNLPSSTVLNASSFAVELIETSKDLQSKLFQQHNSRFIQIYENGYIYVRDLIQDLKQTDFFRTNISLNTTNTAGNANSTSNVNNPSFASGKQTENSINQYYTEQMYILMNSLTVRLAMEIIFPTKYQTIHHKYSKIVQFNFDLLLLVIKDIYYVNLKDRQYEYEYILRNISLLANHNQNSLIAQFPLYFIDSINNEGQIIQSNSGFKWIAHYNLDQANTIIKRIAYQINGLSVNRTSSKIAFQSQNNKILAVQKQNFNCLLTYDQNQTVSLFNLNFNKQFILLANIYENIISQKIDISKAVFAVSQNCQTVKVNTILFIQYRQKSTDPVTYKKSSYQIQSKQNNYSPNLDFIIEGSKLSQFSLYLSNYTLISKSFFYKINEFFVNRDRSRLIVLSYDYKQIEVESQSFIDQTNQSIYETEIIIQYKYLIRVFYPAQASALWASIDLNTGGIINDKKPEVVTSQDLKIICIKTKSPSSNSVVLQNYQISLKFINYEMGTVINLPLPQQLSKQNQNPYILISNGYLYYRQRPVNPAFDTTSLSFSELVFQFDEKLFTFSKIYENQLSPGQISSYKNSSILIANSSLIIKYQNLFMDQLNQKIFVSTRYVPLGKFVDDFNKISFRGNSIYLQNVSIRFCDPGCLVCSNNSFCHECMDGFNLIQPLKICIKCKAVCKTCQQSLSQCTSCLDGYWRNQTNCLACHESCKSCSGNQQNQCLSCNLKFYLSEQNLCVNCSGNCNRCQNQTSCVECRAGYVVSYDKLCIKCPIGCAYCDPARIDVCVQCQNKYELIQVNGFYVCKKCPQNCITCYEGICIQCIQQFAVSVGKCIQLCRIPCSSCDQANSSICLSCLPNYILNGSKCIQNLACNKYNNCTNCPLGYVFQNNFCYKCSVEQNCKSCTIFNLSNCVECHPGYFISIQNLCKPCTQNCSQCESELRCTKCQKNFTLQKNQKLPKCTPCQYPCLECLQFSHICETCVQNYTLQGWNCVSEESIHLVIKLNANLKQFNSSDYLLIQSQLSTKTKKQSSDINLFKVYSGSLFIQYKINPAAENNQSSDELVDNLKAFISQGESLAGYKILSTRFFDQSMQDLNKSQLQKMISVITCCLAIFIIILIFLFIYFRQKIARLFVKKTSAQILNEKTLELKKQLKRYQDQSIAEYSKQQLIYLQQFLKSSSAFVDTNAELLDENDYFYMMDQISKFNKKIKKIKIKFELIQNQLKIQNQLMIDNLQDKENKISELEQKQEEEQGIERILPTGQNMRNDIDRIHSADAEQFLKIQRDERPKFQTFFKSGDKFAHIRPPKRNKISELIISQNQVKKQQEYIQVIQLFDSNQVILQSDEQDSQTSQNKRVRKKKQDQQEPLSQNQKLEKQKEPQQNQKKQNQKKPVYKKVSRPLYQKAFKKQQN